MNMQIALSPLPILRLVRHIRHALRFLLHALSSDFACASFVIFRLPSLLGFLFTPSSASLVIFAASSLYAGRLPHLPFSVSAATASACLFRLSHFLLFLRHAFSWL